jgi:hypothetical protein
MWGTKFAGIAGAVGFVLVTAPVAQAEPLPEPPPGAEDFHDYPIAQGRYTSPAQGDFYHVLPDGYRLENWGASCGVGHQGTLTCTTYGRHGFTISALYGELW